MRNLFLSLALAIGFAAPAAAQFSPVITVNDDAITQYELTQRILMLEAFRTPGDLDALAREQLIEEALKEQALQRAGLQLSEEALARELESFAGRANLTLDQFLTVLRQSGVDRGSLEDFVRIGVSWRDYIRQRYAPRVQITEAEIDRALGQAGPGNGGLEILLSEIIIAAPPPRAAEAAAIAARISRMNTTAAFEAAARQYSALPSREQGGRLGWLPITNYPPAIQGLLLDLAPGEVTAPIPIPNGIALFQGRGLREAPGAPPAPTGIEYAAYYIPGGRSAEALAVARQVELNVDTCDDLYGIARNQPTEVLDRQTQAPAAIPQDIALELARLDRGEVSYNVTRSDGQTLVFLMLCNRSFADGEAPDRDTVRDRLRSQRLAGFANALIADLRASATIRP